MSHGSAPRAQARRFATFCVIGLANTVVDFVVFASLHELAGLGIIPSNVVAFLLAVANSYALNRVITFADRAIGNAFRNAAQFLMFAAIAMVASTATVYLLSAFIPALAAKLVAIAASTLINYVGSNWVVFAAARSARPRLD